MAKRKKTESEAETDVDLSGKVMQLDLFRDRAVSGERLKKWLDLMVYNIKKNGRGRIYIDSWTAAPHTALLYAYKDYITIVM